MTVQSIVLGAELEVGLRMGAHGAYSRGGSADVDVAAVAADPDLLAYAGEAPGLLDVLEQGEVAR